MAWPGLLDLRVAWYQHCSLRVNSRNSLASWRTSLDPEAHLAQQPIEIDQPSLIQSKTGR